MAKIVIAMEKAGRSLEPWRWPEGGTVRLRQDFPAHEFVELSESPRGEAELDDADVVIAWYLSPQQLLRARKLRWLHSPSAGVHQLMVPELIDSPVILTNGASVHGAAVAEHALALMLAMARGLPRSVQQQARHEWNQAAVWEAPGGLSELRDHTALVIGLGHIGGNLARLLKAMGMTVLGIRRHPEQGHPHCDEVHAPAALPGLLARADYVVLALPVTPETETVIGAAELECMPPEARLINVGRGALLDEAALLAALQQEKILGAALDVFVTEPLPADSPLWNCLRLLITPHTGGMTAPTWHRQLDLIGANLRRFLRDEPLEHVVDKRLGY